VLPGLDEEKLNQFVVPKNYKCFDIGFVTFDVPDNSVIQGYLGSERYFAHCADLIRYYFTMTDMVKSYDDSVIIHHRHYPQPEFARMTSDYYKRALSHFPNLPVVVVTNDITEAQKAVGLTCHYVNNSPIVDFNILTKAKYLVMSNSTFSWWGAWLSQAKTVAPKNWYTGSFKDCPTKDLYCDGWILE